MPQNTNIYGAGHDAKGKKGRGLWLDIRQKAGRRPVAEHHAAQSRAAVFRLTPHDQRIRDIVRDIGNAIWGWALQEPEEGEDARD